MFMRYVMARYEEYQRELAYRIYISDTLMITANNTARFGGGVTVDRRFWELIHPAPTDNRTEEEIVSHVCGKLEEMRQQ